MNWNQIQGKWQQAKGRAHAKWADLTDDDLDRIAGNREELVGIVQERYGLAKERAEQEVDEWAKSLDMKH